MCIQFRFLDNGNLKHLPKFWAKWKRAVPLLFVTGLRCSFHHSHACFLLFTLICICSLLFSFRHLRSAFFVFFLVFIASFSFSVRSYPICFCALLSASRSREIFGCDDSTVEVFVFTSRLLCTRVILLFMSRLLFLPLLQQPCFISLCPLVTWLISPRFAVRH